MAQEEDFGGRSGSLELRGFIRKDFAGESVFTGNLKCVGVLLFRRLKRKRQDRLACRHGNRRERQECGFVMGGERIGVGTENSNVVLIVRRDDGSLQENWRSVP